MSNLTDESAPAPFHGTITSAIRSPARTRDLLIVALTLVTGATDAIGFIRLGGVFTSVMTGNMVLIGGNHSPPLVVGVSAGR